MLQSDAPHQTQCAQRHHASVHAKRCTGGTTGGRPAESTRTGGDVPAVAVHQIVRMARKCYDSAMGTPGPTVCGHISDSLR
jgi:hypothetical protein